MLRKLRCSVNSLLSIKFQSVGSPGGNRPWILTDRFGPEMAIFPFFFFLGNIDQENVFYDILELKNAFVGYKNKKFKKSKN